MKLKKIEKQISYYPYIDLILIIVLCLTSFYFLTKFISKPFVGFNDWNSNLWTVTAKNNLNYGLSCTKLGQSTTYFPVEDCRELGFYENYPPLISWLLTLFYSLLGFKEWAGRLAFVLISTASAIFIFLLGKNIKDRFVGFFASLFFIATPVFQYYGQVIHHDPLVLLSSLIAFYTYFLWYKYKEDKFFKFFLFSSIFAGLSGWQVYLVYPILSFFSFFYFRKNFIKSILPIFILFMIFALHQYHIFMLTGIFKFWEMWQQLMVRMNLSKVISVDQSFKNDAIYFTLGQFLNQTYLRINNLFTVNLLILGVCGLGTLIYQKIIKLKKFSLGQQMLLLILSYGLLNLFVFSELVYIHEFLIVYLLPGLVLISAYILNYVKKISSIIEYGLINAFVFFLILILGQKHLQYLHTTNPNTPLLFLSQIVQKKGLNFRYAVESKMMQYQYPLIWNYAYGVKKAEARFDTKDNYIQQKNQIGKTYDFVLLNNIEPLDESLLVYLDNTYEKETINIRVSNPSNHNKSSNIPFYLYNLKKGKINITED